MVHRGTPQQPLMSLLGNPLCRTAIVAIALCLSSAASAAPHAGHTPANTPANTPVTAATPAAEVGFLSTLTGYFSNYGSYLPRTHCMLKADGTPDWPWIGTLIFFTAGIVVGYSKIFAFWRRNYLAELPQDRNRKLMDLANIFLWCAVCGYAMSIVMFVWPAYRLLVVFLVILNVFTWRFASNLGALTVSLSAVRLRRELDESLANRAAELARLVEERTEELNAARAAAIAADEAKSAFLANMSHEIRTPMTAILGFTDLLDNPRLDAATRQRHLRTVRESGRHLLAVVNDILDLARIEAGKLKIDRINCDLHAVIHDVVALLTPRAIERKLTLVHNLDTSVPRYVWTDPTRLRQVLINLVGNSIKFTESGTVTIDVREDATDRSRVSIAVLDTGVGMSAEQIQRLFQRFQQLSSTNARAHGGGSGLGLVISRHLVNLLGGSLDVESEQGRGSRFTVSLPAGAAGSEAMTPRPTHAPASLLDSTPVASTPISSTPVASTFVRSPERRRIDAPVRPRPKLDFPADANVLLVDDGDENRQLVQFLLEQQGLHVDIAEDGQVALDRIEARPDRYGLVLMDIHMPRVDGYAATSTLRARGFGRPIVALTASTMTGDREKCLAAGCDDYISKPIDTDLLLRTVHRLLTETDGAVTAGA